jgi:hypothetical protein
MDYDYVRENQETLRYYTELKIRRSTVAEIGRNLGHGLLYGKGGCLESTITGVLSDFLVIGDVRDLVREGYSHATTGESDKFTMLLAGVGLVATVTEILTAGSTAAGKASVSMMKVAKQTGKMSPALQKSAVELLTHAKETRDVRRLVEVGESLNRMSRIPGFTVRDGLAVMSRMDHMGEIVSMEKVAVKLGNKTAKFLELGGKPAVRCAQKLAHAPDTLKAMDAAAPFGRKGFEILERLGTTEFLRYLKFTKYGARAVRTAWQGRLDDMLFSVFTLIPPAGLWVGLIVGGAGVLAGPLAWIIKRARTARKRVVEA